MIGLLISTTLGLIVGVSPRDLDLSDILNAAVLMQGGAKAERMLGEAGEAVLLNTYSISTNQDSTNRVNAIFNRLIGTAGVQKEGLHYLCTLIGSDAVNAVALPGGKINISEGLTILPGIKESEVAAALAHELVHTNKGHGVSALREQLLLKLGVNLLGKNNGSTQEIVGLVGNYLQAKHSREQELEADRVGFEYLVKAGYDAAAPLSLMRRLQTLESNQKDLFSELFATHPRSVERAKLLKAMYLENRYGETYRTLVASISTTRGGETRPSSVRIEYDCPYTDPSWIAVFEKDTGWKVEAYDNQLAKTYPGECPSFAKAIRNDFPLGPAGSNDAKNWLDRAKEKGLATGIEPQPRSIIVWKDWPATDGKKGNPYGHLAIFKESLPDGNWVVWDSNFGPEAGNKNYTDGIVRKRVIKPDSYIIGCIYPPNGSTDSAGVTEIKLLDHEVYLGDDEHDARTIWDSDFGLSAAILRGAKRAYVKLELKAVPSKDPIISINTKEVGRIVANSTDWKWYETPSFSPQLLRSGQDLIDIETVILDARRSFDDCWIRNVTLVIEH